MPIVNGDFESGTLSSWSPIGNPSGFASVVNVFPHSGKYSLVVQGPTNLSSGYTSGVYQSISPSIPLPVRITGFMAPSLMPTCSQHPYHQFAIYSNLGEVVEFGVGVLPNGDRVIFVSQNTTLTAPMPQGYIKFEVDIYSDHADFWVNNQKIGDTRSSTPNFCFPPSWGYSSLLAAAAKRISTTSQENN